LCRRLPYCSIKLANTRGCVQISATHGEDTMTKLEKDLRWSRFSQPNQGTEKQEDAAGLPC
ncbi:hypothetical protein T07_13260, partial [Trichinella nelsoni]